MSALPLAPLKVAAYLAVTALSSHDGPAGMPEYAIGASAPPCVGEACSGLRLVDVDLGIVANGEARSNARFRLRVGNHAFVGIEAGDQNTNLSVVTAGLELNAGSSDGTRSTSARYQGRGWTAALMAHRRSTSKGGAWGFDLGGSVRLQRSLALRLGGFHDTNGAPLLSVSRRRIRETRAGLTWEHGTGLEVDLNVLTAREVTPGGTELDRTTYSLDALVSPGRWQVSSLFSYDRTGGRFPRKEGFAAVSADLRLGRHLVVHGATLNRWEIGLKKIRRNWEAGFTLFAREHQFERSGPIGQYMRDLVLQARRLGYEGTLVGGEFDLRTLRDRLSLSSELKQLADLIDRLYAAQIDNRNVAQLGARYSHESNELTGHTISRVELFVGVPWPLVLPGTRDVASADFLRFRYARTNRVFTAGLRKASSAFAIELALNRETELRFRRVAAFRTPLQVALDELVGPTLELTIRHLVGR